MQKITTLTDFILAEQHTVPSARGHFTLLLNQIAEAGKIIASHVKRSGLAELMGKAGTTNASHEDVQKLDIYSNQVMVDMLISCGQVSHIGSEELAESLVVPDHQDAPYMVYTDPLDGSSNIDVNVSIGTIFSIYHTDKNPLQPGRKQVAAGYILYGSSVMLVYTSGAGVNGFTLDPAIGTFLLSHPAMKIPKSNKEYSFNEGKYYLLGDTDKQYLDTIKGELYQLRYVGSMVADLHRILIKGGIFLHPSDSKKPGGKLRLMFEVNPMSFIIEQACGKAVSGAESPLDIVPTDPHQRIPIVLGSVAEVDKYLHQK